MELLQTFVDLFINVDWSVISYAIFGIGGSKQESNSQARSTSVSSGTSLAFSRDNVFNAQGHQQVSDMARQAAFQHDPSKIEDAATELFSSGTSFLDRLGGNAGTEFLEDRITNPGFADEQIGLLGEDLGRFFREELLTGISRDATGTNTQGGSRQGVAESLAAREVSQQFTRGATEIRQRDLDARTAAAKSLSDAEIQGAAVGTSALDSLLGIVETGTNAGFTSAGILAEILGDPTILNRSQSESRNASQSTSQASSRGKSAGFNIGFGS